MLIQVLKSKLKEVIVTAADTEYEGSITLDPDLMDAARLVPYERVEVNAKEGTARIVTYVIPGERGSGQVELNGGAANFFEKGEPIHVNCFWFIDPFMKDPKGVRVPFENHVPFIVKTDENNKVI
jgi:aspartate 1-decarboxylase